MSYEKQYVPFSDLIEIQCTYTKRKDIQRTHVCFHHQPI